MNSSPLKHKNNYEAFSIVEAVLSISLAVIVMTLFAGAYIYARDSAYASANSDHAVSYAQEGLEIARQIRDRDYTELADGTYGVVFDTNTNQYDFTATTDSLGELSRSITISTVDADTKRVVSQVNWQNRVGGIKTVTLETSFTSWQDFVVSGDWSSPTVYHSENISGNQNGLRVAVLGEYIYMIRNNSTPDFYQFSISDPLAPVQTNSFSITDRVYGLDVSGSVAVVGGRSNSVEITVFDLSDPVNPVISDTVNLTRSGDVRSVAISGDYVYAARARDTNNSGYEFSVIDISDPYNATEVAGIDLSSLAYDVVVDGNYAYVANSNNNAELQVVDISDPTNPSLVSTYNASGTTNAICIHKWSDYVGLCRGDYVEIYDVSNPLSPTFVSDLYSYDTVRGISTSGSYMFLATDEDGYEFKVADMSDINNPYELAIMNTSGDLNDVVYNSSSDVVYSVGDNNSSELYVIDN